MMRGEERGGGGGAEDLGTLKSASVGMSVQ